MRSKFSELVAMGIAGFEHTPIAQETPQYCPVCHTYNNVWGVITDTHMSCLPNGRRVITGTFVSKTPEWTRLMYASFWGGVRFDTTGYMSLSEFLYTHGLETVAITLNGQPAIELVPCEDCPVSGIACTSYTTTETKFPQPVQRLGGVLECLESGTLKEAVNKLNASVKVPGNHWHVHENKIVGQAYGQTVILEVTFDKGIKVENEELHKMLESVGAGDLFFRQYSRHFVLDSTDPQCKLALKNLDENVIFVKKFDDMTVQEWFENAKCIVAPFRKLNESVLSNDAGMDVMDMYLEFVSEFKKYAANASYMVDRGGDPRIKFTPLLKLDKLGKCLDLARLTEVHDGAVPFFAITYSGTKIEKFSFGKDRNTAFSSIFGKNAICKKPGFDVASYLKVAKNTVAYECPETIVNEINETIDEIVAKNEEN